MAQYGRYAFNLGIDFWFPNPVIIVVRMECRDGNKEGFSNVRTSFFMIAGN